MLAAKHNCAELGHIKSRQAALLMYVCVGAAALVIWLIAVAFPFYGNFSPLQRPLDTFSGGLAPCINVHHHEQYQHTSNTANFLA